MITLEIVSQKSSREAEILEEIRQTLTMITDACVDITLTSLMISRGPTTLASYFTCPRLVRRATSADIIPGCFRRWLSILSTHEAHVMPSILKRIDEDDFYPNDSARYVIAQTI